MWGGDPGWRGRFVCFVNRRYFRHVRARGKPTPWGWWVFAILSWLAVALAARQLVVLALHGGL